MNAESGELLEYFHKATVELQLCPNRVWAVAGEKLPKLLPAFNSTPISKADTAIFNNNRQNTHEICTFDFCEQSQRNFTTVGQRHECKDAKCAQLRGRFPRPILEKSLRDGGSSVWCLNGNSILKPPRPYMAVSHVWSDGTGAGAWDDGQVNECLYEFFQDIAESFECEGIWWDTICIPTNKVARTKAIQNMHNNYNDARFTLVHDCFLRSWEWDPDTACFGILMSPWFSRGWTALELANSHKVKVIFKGRYGPIIKDLDEEILAGCNEPEGPRKAATKIIKLLRTTFRSNGQAAKSQRSGVDGLLRVLGPRHTSWPKDMAVISALLTDTEPNEGLQDTYQGILRKLRWLSHGNLFHRSASMAKGFSWCPVTLFSMPVAGDDEGILEIVSRNGDIRGLWRQYRQPITERLGEDILWDMAHPLIQHQLRNALKERQICRLLAKPDTQPVQKALLVKYIQGKTTGELCHYQYVGPINLRSSLQDAEWDQIELIISGDRSELTVTTDHLENFEGLSRGTTPQDLTDGKESENTIDRLCEAIWRGNVMGVFGMLGSVNMNEPDSLGRYPLHLAAERGAETIVHSLIARDDPEMSLEAYGDNEQTALHYAAWGGSSTIVEALLDNGSNASAIDAHGRTPLHIAAKMGFEPIVQLLLKRDIKAINSKNNNGLTPLHYASIGGHDDVARALTAHGADVKAQDRIGWTPLHCAAETGNERLARILIQHGADINMKDSKVGWTPLHFAALNGQTGMIRLLLNKAAKRDVPDDYSWVPRQFAEINGHVEAMELLYEKDEVVSSEDRWTPLHCIALDTQQGLMKQLLKFNYEAFLNNTNLGLAPLLFAAEHGLKTGIRRLLRKGIDIEKRDADGHTALSRAAEGGHDSAMQLLLENGADIDSVDTVQFRTPLSWASENGHDVVVQLLVDKGAKAECADLNGWTPILHAASNCNRSVVQILLDYGADFEHQDKKSQTPLLHAAKKGHKEIVQLLLSRGATITGADRIYGRTPLWWALDGGHEQVAQVLLENNAKLDHTDNNGQTLATWAAENGYKPIIQLMVDKGVDLNKKDKFGQTPLSWAAEHGHEDVIRLLLSNGHDIDATDRVYGRDLLSWASLNGNIAIVKMLLDQGANINHADEKYGRMPLSYATGNGHLAIAELLVDAGAELHSKDNKGCTTLFYAVKGGHRDAVQYLVRCGADLNDNHDDRGNTALTVALSMDDLDLVQFLLELGAAVNPTDQCRSIPLSYAINKGCKDTTLRILIQHGARVEVKTSSGASPLALAAEKGCIDSARLLLENGANVLSRDNYGHTPLSSAALKGLKDIVQLLIDNGADAELTYTSLSLYNAASRGHSAIVALLLERGGGDINYRHYHGKTALFNAMAHKDLASISLLIEKGAKVDFMNEDDGQVILSWAVKNCEAILDLLIGKSTDLEVGMSRSEKAESTDTPESESQGFFQRLIDKQTVDVYGDEAARIKTLAWAAEKGHTTIVRLLIDRGANFEMSDSLDYTPLAQAARYGHTATVQLLLNRGADPQRGNLFMLDTPLSFAAGEGHLSVVQLILGREDSLERIDSLGGRMALAVAAENGHDALVRLLIAKGVDFKSNPNYLGPQTALERAAMKGHHTTVELLLKEGACFDITAKFSDKPLWWAAKHGIGSLGQLVAENEADLETTDNNRRTPISTAAEKGHEDFVQFVIQKGANIESIDKDGRTPLSYAAEHGHAGIIQILLDNGANPNLKDNKGRTPLYWATEKGHAPVVSILLGHCSPDSKDYIHGRTPLWVAAERGYENIMQILVGKGANINSRDKEYGITPLCQRLRFITRSVV